MIQQAALAALLLAGGWLVFVAAVCLVRPDLAHAGLAAFGGTWTIQIGEHLLRGLAGTAMIVRAPLSKAPDVFAVAGWFVVGSSLLILVLPKRWHNAYSVWWAERIPRWGFRLIAVPTVALACALVWAAV